jgi:hypothetical protein
VEDEAMKNRKGQNGHRLSKQKADRRLRKMRIVTALGMAPVTIHGSRQASKLALYMNAVGIFLRTGSSDALEQFEGKVISGHRLVTDPELLSSLAHGGTLELESLYVTPEPSP